MPSAALLSDQVAASSPLGRMEQNGTDAEMPPGLWSGDSQSCRIRMCAVLSGTGEPLEAACGWLFLG